MTADVLVLDASPLIHFDRAGELTTLETLVGKFDCVTTKAVLDELRRGRDTTRSPFPDLPWVRVVACDDLATLYLFSQYLNQLGNAQRNAGEASVLAWADLNSATAYLDDQVAVNAGRKRNVRVRRTLSLIIDCVRDGLMAESRAQDLVRTLADTDARFPEEARDDLFGWARAQDPPLI